MEVTVRLLDEARRILRPRGWIAIEVDCSRAGLAARHADALGWQDVMIHMDLFGRERYLLARRSNGR
jgi:methylase of polypeptide subunit release factors